MPAAKTGNNKDIDPKEKRTIRDKKTVQEKRTKTALRSESGFISFVVRHEIGFSPGFCCILLVLK